MREAATLHVESDSELKVTEEFMSVESKSESAQLDTSDEKNERIRFLIGAYDKHLERFDKSFSSLNQKATWTLATATGFVGISGFTRHASIVKMIQNGSINMESYEAVFMVFYAFVYLTLLWHVLKVYRPKEVEYPVSPFDAVNLRSLEKPVDENSEIRKLVWKDVQDHYINSHTMGFLQSVLQEHIDAIGTAYLLNLSMDQFMQRAFNLLLLFSMLSLFLWFIV